MKIHAKIPINYLEVFGTSSLTGLILSQNPEVPFDQIREVDLIIERTSSHWKEKNNGPHLTLVPEYVFECLLEDVVRLTNRGIKFNLLHVLVNP